MINIEKTKNEGWIVSVEKEDTYQTDKFIFTKLSDMTAWLHVYYTNLNHPMDIKPTPLEWVKGNKDGTDYVPF